MTNKRETEEFLQRLQALCEDIGIDKPSNSEEELLDHFEKWSKIRTHKRSWIEHADQVSWLGTTWIFERRLSRQIVLVRKLGVVIGWRAPATIDALLELDDLAFAVTYGARAPKAIKDSVREIAKKGLMAPFELRNLLRNHRLLLSSHGQVVAKESKYLMPTAVIVLALFTIAMMAPLIIGLWAPINFFPKLVGTSAISVLYWTCCSLVASFLVIPHRLTPKIRRSLEQLHASSKPSLSVITR